MIIIRTLLLRFYVLNAVNVLLLRDTTTNFLLTIASHMAKNCSLSLIIYGFRNGMVTVI